MSEEGQGNTDALVRRFLSDNHIDNLNIAKSVNTILQVSLADDQREAFLAYVVAAKWLPLDVADGLYDYFRQHHDDAAADTDVDHAADDHQEARGHVHASHHDDATTAVDDAADDRQEGRRDTDTISTNDLPEGGAGNLIENIGEVSGKDRGGEVVQIENDGIGGAAEDRGQHQPLAENQQDAPNKDASTAETPLVGEDFTPSLEYSGSGSNPQQ